MLCKAKKQNGEYCNNMAKKGMNTCHIASHQSQLKKQKGG